MPFVIDIVVAHYNGSAFICDQIESIQNNIIENDLELNILVIDDASRTDEFQRLLIAAERWPNVQVVRNEINLGVIKTFEKGLGLSQASYVMLCDQDDVWLPDKISLTYKKMREVELNQPALVFTELTTVDQKLRTIDERMINMKSFISDSEKHKLLFQNLVTGCTAMINRKLIQLALPFPPNIPMHDHWLAICAAFTGRLGFVERPTILYRQHSANLVGQPQRSLMTWLSKPFETITRFNKGLGQKAQQTAELSRRLPINSDRALLEQVGLAFRNRTVANLKFLLRARVFTGNHLTRSLLCLLYLLPSRKTHAAQ